MKRKVVIKLFFLLIVIALSACGTNGKIPDQFDWEVIDFEGTNVDGETITLSDLKGKVWIANFGFTNCLKVCPPQTANIAQLQKRLKEADIPVQFVTFTVDPDRDKPKVLENFIKERGGDLSNWYALTGYSFENIQTLSETSFKFPVSKPPEGSDQLSHGTGLYLVNEEGIVIKRYDGLSPPYDEIEEHVKLLTK